MKKKIIMLLTGVFAASMILTGCEGSKGLETDALTISKYKGVEVDEVEKAKEITDEDVENTINSTLQTNATTNEITDRPVQEVDTATIDFVGKIDGVEFEYNKSREDIVQTLYLVKKGEIKNWDNRTSKFKIKEVNNDNG